MVSEKSKSSAAENSVDSVHSVQNPSSDRINKMGKMGSESGTSNSDHSVDSVQNPLPNSRKVFVTGKLHPDIRVPFREISLAPTKTMNGEIEVNEPVRVYDTSGPWGDPSVTLDPVKGLPPLRRDWILARDDVEEIEGRAVTPIDDGYLSVSHAEHSAKRNGNGNGQSASKLLAPSSKLPRRPLRAKPGKAVTQLYYARQGVITPEMEFIAVRESHGQQSRKSKVESRNDLDQQHAGESFGANIPREITPEFVRDEVARGKFRRKYSARNHTGICARRSCARARDHPCEHQSPRKRADDHRP